MVEPIGYETLWGEPRSGKVARDSAAEMVETLVCPYTKEKCNAWEGECLLKGENKCLLK